MIMNLLSRLLAEKTMSHPTRVCVEDVMDRTKATKMMGVLLGRKSLSLTPLQGIATTLVK